MKELKKLWHTVFGDGYSVIDSYFDTFYSPALTAAEYIDGKLAAAAYVMPAGFFVNGDTREKCAHIYAVAVYPGFRGKGLGISVTNKAVKLAQDAGFSAIILHPAEESLFRYYEKHCGFTQAFSASVSAHSLPFAKKSAAPVDTAAYQSARQKHLCGIPHVELSSEVLSFFQKCGGKLYVFEGGCAAVEVCGDTAYFRELLGSIPDPAALAAMAGTEKCVISAPGASFPTGMIFGESSAKNSWMSLTLE